MKGSIYVWSGTLGVLLFGVGLMVGREFPVHHYERISGSPYLFDNSTGHVCDTRILKAETLSSQPTQPGAPAGTISVDEFLATIKPCN
jgi:hypothetical protein